MTLSQIDQGSTRKVSRRPARWRRRTGIVLAITVLGLAVAWALVPGAFTPLDPLKQDTADTFAAPTLAHPFGTDYLGRDLYARVVHGAGLSLLSGVIAVSIGFIVGCALGAIAGWFGGWVDAVITRLLDTVLSIPFVLLTMSIITVIGFGTVNVAAAVGFVSVANFARLLRSQLLSWKQRDFVEAAVIAGRGPVYIVSAHLLPHAVPPVLSMLGIEFGAAMLAVASLSFLGFGAQPPSADWGTLISSGTQYLSFAWWLSLFPATVVVAVVIASGYLSRLDWKTR